MDSYLKERYEKRINGLRMQVQALEEENEYLKGEGTRIASDRADLKKTIHNLMKRGT